MSEDLHDGPADPRAGFVDPGIGGFAGEIGPILVKVTEDIAFCGFEVEQRHCNPSGVCHGGWLSTFADVMAVRQLSLISGLPARAVRTINLSCSFLDASMRGDWVHGRATLMRQTGTMAFLQGSAEVGDRTILSFTAIMRIFRPRP